VPFTNGYGIIGTAFALNGHAQACTLLLPWRAVFDLTHFQLGQHISTLTDCWSGRLSILQILNFNYPPFMCWPSLRFSVAPLCLTYDMHQAMAMHYLKLHCSTLTPHHPLIPF
jgi:hypothetical protein